MDNDLVNAVARAISGSGVTSPRSIRQAQAAIAAYEAASATRIRELEEALRPFANVASTLSSEDWQDDDILAVVDGQGCEDAPFFRFAVLDIRRAHAVLEGEK